MATRKGSDKKDNMASLSEARKTEYKETFALLDVNGDGKICAKELGTLMKSMGWEAAEATKVLKSVDADNDGEIDFDEFLVLMNDKATKDTGDFDRIKATFKAFDIDGNGFITTQELRKAMEDAGEKLTDKEVQNMIDQADKDGDGQVNFDEFLRMMS
eukprot:TRINITY_DN1560_c0_g1_i1.p1 TRINITY_DN1560_c0_g1~~TRINITY_DN1560_c0_g1_i1.p1  ORF type:complete len:158 (+),score=44.73 TRINITY_DN1560_c0_g1_i1:43-516(+)